MGSGVAEVGPNGLIFLAVVVLWAGYLVPLWARDRARAAQARQAQRDSDLMQRADASQPRVVLTTSQPTLTSTARLNAVARAERHIVRARRALRRGRAARVTGLVVGVVLLLAAGVGVLASAWSVWAPAVAAGWLVTTTTAGAAVAANDRHRLAGARRRLAVARTVQPARPARTEPVALFDRGGVPDPDAAGVEGDDAGTSAQPWTPVDLPRPTYTMAPRITHAPPLPWDERPAAPAVTPTPVPVAPAAAPPAAGSGDGERQATG